MSGRGGSPPTKAVSEADDKQGNIPSASVGHSDRAGDIEPVADSEKTANKSLPGDSHGASDTPSGSDDRKTEGPNNQEKDDKRPRSVTYSETSNGKERIQTASGGSGRNSSTKSRGQIDHQNQTGFRIRIGGRTYSINDSVNRRPSLSSSTRSRKSSSTTSQPPIASSAPFYGQRPVVSSSHGVHYLPSEKPFIGLQTIQALNSAHPFGQRQNSYSYSSYPASAYSVKDSSEMKSSTLAGDLCQVFSVFFAIAVRLVLAVFSIVTVMVVVDKRNDERFWALTAILGLLVIEGAVTVVKRRGQERRW